MNASDEPPQLPRLFDGLPGTLLVCNDQGVARYVSVLPMLSERSYRRWLAKNLRRKLGFEGDDDLTVIEQYLCSRLIRQDMFWHTARRMEMASSGDVGMQMTLELHLLRDAVSRYNPPPFDAARFASECPEWPAVKKCLERVAGKRIEQIDPQILQFLMCWAPLKGAIATWDGIARDQWPTLEAIFALSSITNSEWFLNEALRVCPMAAEWLGEIFENAIAAEELFAMATAEISATAPDWSGMAADLAEVAERLASVKGMDWDGTGQAAMIGKLQKVLAVLTRYDPRNVRARRDQVLGKLEAAVRSFENEPAFLLVVPELKSRLAEYRERASTAPEEDLESLVTALAQAADLLEQRARELNEAYTARQEIRSEYHAARAAADASPSLASQRAAHQLRERDAAAEGAFLNAQVALLDALALAPAQSATAGQSATESPQDEQAGTAQTAEPSLPVTQPAGKPVAGANGASEVPAQDSSARPEAIESPASPVQLPRARPREAAVAGPVSATRVALEPLAEVEAPETAAVSPTTPIPDVPEVPAEQADAPEAVLATQVWGALSQRQLAVAYQLAQLAQAEGTQAPGAPPVPLLRALVLANELLQPDGRIAAEITSAFARLDIDALTGPAEARAATQLLVAAAVLRPLLLAPDSAAPDLAARARLPDGCAELYTLLQEFVAATSGLRHYRLSARAFAAVRDEGAWRGELQRLEGEIRDWRARAPLFRIKYQPATAIWREWQKPGGEIDRLLAPISSSGPTAEDRVQAQLARLSDPELLDGAIKEADRKSKRRGEPIHGAALEQLHLHVNEACALAQQWLALIGAKPAKDGPRLRDLDRAHAALADHREQADKELEQLARHADGRIAAAAAIARESLAQVWALFEPERTLPTAEKNVQHLLAWPLLQMTECAVRHDWSLRDAAHVVREALIARLQASPDLRGSFEARLKRGDVVGATLLAELAAADDPAAAAQMRARLEPATKEYWAAQRQQLLRIGESIQSSIVYGVLSSEEGDAFSARLAALEQRLEDLAQADAIEEGASAIREEIAALADRRRKDLDEAVNEIRGSAAPADLEILEQALQAHDLPSANEYLTRIRSGERLAGTAARPRDPFDELFGTQVARDIETFLNGKGRNPRDLVAHIVRGSPIGALDFSEVPEAQRKEAGTLIELWLELKRSLGGPLQSPAPQPGNDRRLKTLHQLLGLLGFTSVRVLRSNPSSGEVLEVELECDTLADRGICPVSYFGSSAQGRYRVLCVSEGMSIDQLVTRVGPTVNARPTCVLYLGRLGERQRRELAAQTRLRRRAFIVVDEGLLIFLTRERGSRLPALFACTLPFASFDPYVTTSSFVPPELFFGRHQELDRLLDPLGACFVYGGRQLGKTALLKHAERAFHAPERRHYAAWIDLKGAHIGWAPETDATHVWRPIWKRMVEVGLLPATIPDPRPTVKGRVEQFLGVLESWLATHREGRILLLLDEADRFLEDDARRGYLDTIRLKRLMEGSNRRFKVAFAGLHNVLRAAEQANHPLGHFGEPIEIGPLIKDSEWRDAQQLVLGPLAAAGFKLERPGLADRILAQTNFYPSLIQLYCSKLIGRMMEEGRFSGGPRFLIKEQKLDETYLSKDLRDEIRQKFRLTLQLDPRYAVIAYAIAHHSYAQRGARAGTFTPAELAAMARDWWEEGFARTSAPEFRIILEEMVGLGVLRAGEEGRFTLRNPNLLLLMGTEEEVNEELLRPRDLPEVFAPQEFHPALAGDGAIAGRHPLTMTQISALGSRRDAVVIVSGTRAAGIERVAAALKSDHGDAHLVSLGPVLSPQDFAQELHERLAARPKDSTSLFLVSPECAWSEAWVEMAQVELRKLSSKDRRAKVLFIADAGAAVSDGLLSLPHLEGVEVMTVRPWSEGFVRQWLEETRPGDGPAERAALGACTGFWPLLIERSAEEAAAQVPLEMFVGQHAMLGQVVIALAEYGGAGEAREAIQAEELAALIEQDTAHVRRVLTLAEMVGIAARAARGGWRLEQGLASLLHHQRIARA